MKNIDYIEELHTTYGELYALMKWAAEADSAIVYIDGRRCRTQADFLHFMAVAMNFPYDFDYTWESFDRFAFGQNATGAHKGLLVVLDHAEDMFSPRLSPLSSENETEASLKVKAHLNELSRKRTSGGMPTAVYLNFTDR